MQELKTLDVTAAAIDQDLKALHADLAAINQTLVIIAGEIQALVKIFTPAPVTGIDVIPGKPVSH